MIMIVMSIAIVVDVSEKLGSFRDHNLSFSDVAFGYYPYFFLHYVNMFSSLIIFLAVLFFTSIMAQRSEIIAILSNGVSFARFTRPYMIVSTILLVFSLFMNHLFVPHANKKRLEFESKFFPVAGSFKNVNLQMNENTIVHFNTFSSQKNMVNRMWVEKWEENESGNMEMVQDMQIHVAVGDSASNNWSLHNVFIRDIKDSNEVIRQIPAIDTTLSFSVRDLGQRNDAMYAMTTEELHVFENQEIKKGSDLVTNIQIVLYERSAYPFAAYILTLIGISVASRKSREGLGKNIIIGIIASVSYIFFMKMTTVAATNVGLSPAIAVWVPNFVFAIVALILYRDRLRNEEPPKFFMWLYKLFPSKTKATR